MLAERTGRARVLFRFGDHVLDTDRREFRRGTELIALEPQVFDLLVFLMRNRDRVVSKDELIHSIWDGRIVSDSTLTTRLNAARRAVNDSGAEQRVIRTVQRKGVRFVGEVREDRELAPLSEVPPSARSFPASRVCRSSSCPSSISATIRIGNISRTALRAT
jgi:DNA-binding winged helix-turn-helix (wHTH) protein